MISHRKLLLFCSCLLAAMLTQPLIQPACAASEADSDFVISQVPIRITVPGVYQLTEDLKLAEPRGAAVTVEADHVTIDLNGHTLSGSAGRNTLATGVSAVGRSHVAVTNGRITGFYFGIDLRKSTNGVSHAHVVSNLTLAQNLYFGMRVEGTDCVVRHCTVTDTGDSSRPGHTIPHGVRLVGAGNVMRDCTIIDLRLRRFDRGRGEIVGVHFDAAKDCVFERNTVIELTNDGDDPVPLDESQERTFGMWINGGPQNDTFVEVRDCRFSGFVVPIAFAPGSDGRVTGNTFYDADVKPIRGQPAGQLSLNKSFPADAHN